MEEEEITSLRLTSAGNPNEGGLIIGGGGLGQATSDEDASSYMNSTHGCQGFMANPPPHLSGMSGGYNTHATGFPMRSPLSI
jgi:hypothetical protein